MKNIVYYLKALHISRHLPNENVACYLKGGGI